MASDNEYHCLEVYKTIPGRIIMISLVLSLLTAPWLAVGYNNTSVIADTVTGPGREEPDMRSQLALEDAEEPRIRPYGNLLEGGGFEDGNYSSFTGTYPGGWAPLDYPDRRHWYADSPAFGSASGGLRARSTYWGSEVTARWYQSLQAPIGNLSLSLQWWLESNSDPAPSRNTYRVHLQFSYNRHIYYYLSGSMNTGNGSSSTSYLINGDAQMWHLLMRNVTADYLATGSMPYSPDRNLTRIDIEIYCRVATTSYTEGYVDNVAILNGTYVQIGASTKNGGFESTSDWLTLQNSTSGTADLAEYSAEGSKSLNLTLVTDGTQGGVGVRQWLKTRFTASSTHWLSWQYYAHDDDYVGKNMMTSVQVSCRNATNTFSVNYVIESRLGMMPSNTSNALWFDLGVVFRGWIQEDHNLWTEASAYFATDEIWVTQIAIRIDSEEYAGNQRYEMLWDDVQLVGGYVEDPGFEEQGAVGDYVRSSLSDSHFFKVTNTSYRGEKAANYTFEDWIGSYSETLGINDFPQEGAAFVDIMWQLYDYTPTTNTYARVQLRADDLYSIYYYLGAYGPDFDTNTTYEVYLNTTDVNVVGSWHRFQCNIQDAFQTVFNYTLERIDYVDIEIRTDGTYDFTLLLDDLYVYTDVAPPTIISVDMASSRATRDSHPVTVEVDEWPGTPGGTLSYRYKCENPLTYTTWTAIAMSLSPGEPAELSASIPAYDDSTELLTPLWPLEAEFYIEVDDGLGNVIVDDNGTDYYSYALIDNTAPTITITNLQPNATYTGTRVFSISGSDYQSGVAGLEAFVDGALVDSSLIASVTTTFSTDIEWITNHWSDGNHNWTIRSWDNEDNYAEVTFTVTVRNASSPILPIAIAAAVGVTAIVLVGGYWYLRVRPKGS